MSRYVEEYEVGKPFPLSPGRTISEADINLFAGLVGDFTPIHVDANYAGKTAFGGRIAHGTLTMSTAIGLLTQLNLLGEGVIALLNLNFDFKGVVMIGDTIYARVTPAEARKSSKPGAGVVKFAFEVINQRDELIQVGTMTVLMKTKDHPVPIKRMGLPMFDANAAAHYLIGQRKPEAVLGGALPDEFHPKTLQEAIAVQMATMAALGPIGGWKVGASNATAEPSASPLALSGIRTSPATIHARTRIAECEIGFRFAKALPPRNTPYTADEVLAAIGTCQATIEAVDPRFTDPSSLDQLTILADCGMHGGLVVGEPIAEWRPGMFAALHVVSTVNDALQREAVGSNPGGTDLMRLLVWLVNSEVVRAAGGLTAGVVGTTGSWTGADLLPAGAHVVGRFDGFPPVEATFA